MQDWAVCGAHSFAIRYQKLCVIRNVVTRVQQDIRTTFNKTLGSVNVINVKDEHVCMRERPAAWVTASSNIMVVL